LADDLLIGCRAIADETGFTEAQINYFASRGLLPLFKVGARWCGRRSELRTALTAKPVTDAQGLTIIMTVVLGIDPGIRGGLAVVRLLESGPRLIDTIDIPVIGTGAKERVDAIALRTWLLGHTPDRAFVERAGAMPGQGVSSTFKFGRAAGAIDAIIAACEILVEIIEAAVWKRALRLRGRDKEASRQYALQLFPSAHGLLARKKDHQRAEAALIAVFGINHLLPSVEGVR
jgi:crossover junction endodeoxyribonuclease RuvC